MKNYIAKLFGCPCACHSYKRKLEHSSKCCKLMNGYVEKHKIEPTEDAFGYHALTKVQDGRNNTAEGRIILTKIIAKSGE